MTEYKKIKLGVIADDFTGATDIASFMVAEGWRVILLIGTPTNNLDLDATLKDVDAIVISLKSRSCTPNIAIKESINAAKWLKKEGVAQLYFKYCSTFDSSEKGNIGPVTDALMQEFSLQQTVFCPALPINGRTVLHGHLFVNGQLLNESGMQNHPVTPMRDANLCRVLAAQSKHLVGLIDYVTIDQDAISQQIQLLSEQGVQYFIVDTAHNAHLEVIARFVKSWELVTGGSGLAGALAKIDQENKQTKLLKNDLISSPISTKTVIFSGSCSVMTCQQVAYYQEINAPCFEIEVQKAIHDQNYADLICAWALDQLALNKTLAPLIFATQTADQLKRIQTEFGAARASEAIEELFAKVASQLKAQGVQNFIVAGGETSGAVTQALDITGFYIGASIAPGVPWVLDIDSECFLALKSGNFGQITFFEDAQKMKG